LKEFEKLDSTHEQKSNGTNSGGEAIKNEIIFYKAVTDADDKVKDVNIQHVKLIQLFYSWGYRRYDIGQGFIFIHINDHVIKQVTNQQILDHLIEYIDKLPFILPYYKSNVEIKRDVLKEKIFKCPQNYCSPQKLALLKNKEEIIFNADTKNECFIYYKNGFVVCTKDNWERKPYSELSGFIWEEQIIKRDFYFKEVDIDNIKALSVYGQFLFNVSGQKSNRFYSLCSLTGYLLSGFTNTKMKAVILTDSSLSELANGRTGKTLYGQTLAYIKKTTIIGGKDFDNLNRYKYQEANLDTQIVFLNDVRKNFDFDVLYTDITEGIKVEKKNQDPFIIKPKICISTNKTIKIHGGSSEDRCIEFEFSDHYKAGYGPDNEFSHRFFTDWTKEQYNQFDNFMMFCLCTYLGNGIIQPESINLNRRKLADETDPNFVDFMDQITGLKELEFDPITRQKHLESPFVKAINSGEYVKKQDLHHEFLIENIELKEHKYKGRLETFTKWVKLYVKYDFRYKAIEEKKSGSDRYFKFLSDK
jgi:hypothetical protein